jgi:hypothetical protein
VGSYYYLAAQLPCLIYGQNPTMSSFAFREMVRPLLEEKDAYFLDLCYLDPAGVAPDEKDASHSVIEEDGPAYADNAHASGSDFIDNWRIWERTLRLNLARYRSQKIKREGGVLVEPPAFPADAVSAALRAAAAESALDAELILDRARWDAIDYLQGIDYFDRNTVYAFLLKLMLLERKAAFKVEEGFSEYKALYASILEGVELGMSPGGEPK